MHAKYVAWLDVIGERATKCLTVENYGTTKSKRAAIRTRARRTR